MIKHNLVFKSHVLQKSWILEPITLFIVITPSILNAPTLNWSEQQKAIGSGAIGLAWEQGGWKESWATMSTWQKLALPNKQPPFPSEFHPFTSDFQRQSWKIVVFRWRIKVEDVQGEGGSGGAKPGGQNHDFKFSCWCHRQHRRWHDNVQTIQPLYL